MTYQNGMRGNLAGLECEELVRVVDLEVLRHSSGLRTGDNRSTTAGNAAAGTAVGFVYEELLVLTFARHSESNASFKMSFARR